MVFMSGYAAHDLLRDALAVPGAMLLQKPLNLETLLDSIRTGLDREARV